MNNDATAFPSLERWMHRLAGGLAFFGGFCLIIASALTGLSIIGSLTFKPLPGEIELVEALCGLAVFSFLPYCQLHKGHVGVDLFVNALGPKAVIWTQIVGDAVVTVLFALITWRHWLGTVDKFHNGEITTILFLPVWWGYAVAFVLLVANLAICIYTVFGDIRDLRRGKEIELPLGGHG
jgi:TRAP-type C4-dicarboxylate transport system permease small subunit